MRAGLVHRIDKSTSGLLVVAKNEQAHARLAKQFFDHTIQRRYVALCGAISTRTRDGHGQHRPQPPRRQKMFVFRRRVGRCQCHSDPLAGAETLQLVTAHRMWARKRAARTRYASHVVARDIALQRRPAMAATAS